MTDTLPLSGIQTKHIIRTPVLGDFQWFRIDLTEHSSVENLPSVVDKFEALRTEFIQSDNGWRQRIVDADEAIAKSRSLASSPGTQIPDLSIHVSDTPTGKALFAHHSVLDIISMTTVKDALAGRYTDDTPIMHPRAVFDLEGTKRAADALEFWRDYHEVRRGHLYEARDALPHAVEMHETSVRVSASYIANLAEYARSMNVSVPTIILSYAVRGVADALALDSITLLSVYSNAHLLMGRTPGACLAQDVYVTVSPPEMTKEDLSLFHRELIKAYSNGIYKWDELVGTRNYVATGNFSRDLNVFIDPNMTRVASDASPGPIQVLDNNERRFMRSCEQAQNRIVDIDFHRHGSDDVTIRCRSWLDRHLPKRILASFLKPGLDGVGPVDG